MDNKKLSKGKKILIYSIAAFIAVVAGLGGFGYYYYKFIYLRRPIFDDTQSNFISSATDGVVKPGDIIEYTLNYKNNGNVSVENLNIKFTVPENTTFKSSDKQEIFSSGDDGKTINFNVGTLEKGKQDTISFKVEVAKPLDDGTVIELDNAEFKYNTNQEEHNLKIGPGLSNKVKSSPNLENFNMEVVDVNRGELHLGDRISYKFKFENTGDMNAYNVEVVGNFSEYTDILVNTISQGGKYSGNSVTWTMDELEINDPQYLYFETKIREDLTDDVLISSKGVLKNGDQTFEKESEIQLKLYPDLSTSEEFLSDDNGGYLWSGETIGVKVVIKNTGEKKEAEYKLVCPIPKGATYISKSGTPEGIRWSDDIRGLIWDLGNLGVGEEKVITFKMTVDENLATSGGTITTGFKIESSTGDIEIPSKSIKVLGRVNLTVVAMGDSLIGKSNWVQLFDGMLEARYPYADYNTIPSAVNGELSRQGLARFDSTVAVLHPDIVIFAYGTNDVGPIPSGFPSNIEGLIVKAQSTGARVFINLIGPIFYPGKEGYPKYNDAIRAIAAAHGAVVIDVLTPLSQNPGAYLADSMHYSPEGASVVAHTVFNYVTQYLGTVGQKL